MAEESPVIKKTVELCQTILDQPAYGKMKEDIMNFLQNEEARAHYDRLCDVQDQLQKKQRSGEVITDDEIAAFHREEEAFMGMEVASAFVDAQQKMHKIEATVTDYVRKTFELGRVPTSGDFSSGGCGAGCGCSGG